MMEVCQQLRERDQNILRLEGKVLELDRQVIDLQVNNLKKTFPGSQLYIVFLFLTSGYLK